MPPARTSITIRPGSTVRSWLLAASVTGSSSRSNAACGSSIRRVWTPIASPFSSIHASSASCRRRIRGSSLISVASPCGGFGEITRRSWEDQRSLPYWPKT